MSGQPTVAGPTEISATLPARLAQAAALLSFLLVLWLPVAPDLPPEARRVAAVACAMGILWLTQAIPLAATSLIPLAAFPLLGVLSAKEVSQSYINESVFLYLGGFILALGIERWGLHRRIALHVVRVVGCGPRRLVLGFALATAFLSMWISNTAAALLMVPIAMALLSSLEEIARGNVQFESREHGHATSAFNQLGLAVMLGIAYSASIGGMTTLIGTPTNLAFRQIYQNLYPDADEISVGAWMMAFVPLGVAMLLVMWVLLAARLRPLPGTESLGRQFFLQRLKALGTPSPAERRMFVLFVITALLWIFRTPLRWGSSVTDTLPGWGPWLASRLVRMGVEADAAERMADDSTVAMTVAALLFLIPAGRSWEKSAIAATDSGTAENAGTAAVPPKRNLMNWETANRLPWEILLLFGGGFALADGFASSHLSEWFGEQFHNVVAGQPTWVLIASTCFLLTFLTEFTSNTATCNIVLPILAATASSLRIDPQLLMVPAALSASCAFMLPVATPPNAIIFASGRVSVMSMARYGLLLNLAGVVLITLATLFLYVPQMNIETGGAQAGSEVKASVKAGM